MEPFAIAVKAFVIRDGRLLLIKRGDDAPDKPGKWDLPGGRLDPGENPYDGLKREAMEEVGLGIEVLYPLEVAHFTRDDGQLITNIRFLCTTDGKVKLGDEHTEHSWFSLDEARKVVPEYFIPMIETYERFFQKAI